MSKLRNAKVSWSRLAGRIMAAFLLVGIATACSRPLSENETSLAGALFGETLNAEAVRVRAGAGITPLPNRHEPVREPGAATPEPRKPPEGICIREQSTTRTWRWPAAFALWNDVFFSYRFYAHDTFAGWPQSVPVPQSLIMAHELVHVWQWQNRSRTNYRPATSAQEGIDNIDPYWWTVEDGRDFLSYGYEQQAAMVEDFVCYALFAPDDPKLDELHQILSPVLPVDKFLAQVGRARLQG